MNKKLLKRIICKIVGHKYKFFYASYSQKNGQKKVYKCSRCENKIRKPIIQNK